jgi:hypothetical protein
MRELEKIAREFARFRRLHFPAGSLDDEVGALHAELVLMDAGVAGAVSMATGGDAPKDDLANLEDALRQLKIRMQDATRQKTGPLGNDLRAYTEYAEELLHLIVVTREALGQG